MPALSRPVNEWPLILCGPILRRVDGDSVSVFVALRFKRRITLSVFACNEQGEPNRSLGQSAPTETRRLGKRLHVAVITASGLSLQPLQLCAYDLSFERVVADLPEDVGPVQTSLESLGLLSGDNALGYVDRLKPTFCVPTDQANALKFIHASCRQLHGEGVDAFPHIDEVIKGLRIDPYNRPQMMFLTGDQIYADDVAAPLIPVLTEVGNKLLGWTEEEKIPTAYGNAPVSTCWPGLRNLIVDQAGFTAGPDKSACHLLGLGDYYAMYLMTWSDALWPANFPDPADIYPAVVFERGRGPHNPLGCDVSSSFHDYLCNHAWRFIKETQAQWSQQVTILLKIKETLPAVRRLMANVPIFMMFDDHEVTDDWNLLRKWHQDAYGSKLGRRIIGNALSAYAVFQAWGNDPLGEFSPPQPGGQLLSTLEVVGTLDGPSYKEGNGAYDQVRALTRVVPSSTSGGVKWDYWFERGNYRVIAIDSRTRRDFTHEAQADLMPPTELDRQIAGCLQTSKALTLVVSPLPVFGHPFHERIVKGLVGSFAPQFVDKESWFNEEYPASLEGLLDRLSQAERIIILSGDVHYGFTSFVRYWNDRPGRKVRAAIVQLCSSALKKEDGLTRTLGDAGTEAQRTMLRAGGTTVGSVLGVGAPIAGALVQVAGQALPDAVMPPWEEDYIGWATGPVKLTQADGHTRVVSTRPPVFRLESGIPQTADKVPEWRYRLGFAPDLRIWRGGPPPASVQPRPAGSLSTKLKRWLAEEYRQLKNSNGDRILVGRNNFGRVTVRGELPHLHVVHELWFRPEEWQPIHCYTIHSSSLNIPDQAETPPFSPTSPQAGLPDLSAWGKLMSFRPTLTLQEKVWQLNLRHPGKWFFYPLESGWGPINVDLYAVQIEQLPRSLPGDGAGTSRTVTLGELCQFVRRNLLNDNVVVDSQFGSFQPYEPEDRRAWGGTASEALGALISIAIPIYQSAVITTLSEDMLWSFTTLHSPSEGSHHLSGNRQFGVVQTDDNRTLVYTMGAERCNNYRYVQDPTLQEDVWYRADRLWRSFQGKIEAIVSTHGGKATVLAPFSRRYDWPHVMSAYFAPTMDWKK